MFSTTTLVSLLDHLYIFASLFLGIYSQLIMRWQVGLAGSLPETMVGKVFFVLNLFTNPWIISGLVATFFAGVAWMMVMTKFEISYAYPWMSLNFVLVTLFSVWLFGESYSLGKIIGVSVIVLGIIILAKAQ